MHINVRVKVKSYRKLVQQSKTGFKLHVMSVFYIVGYNWHGALMNTKPSW